MINNYEYKIMNTDIDINSPTYQREKKQTFIICIFVIIIVVVLIVCI